MAKSRLKVTKVYEDKVELDIQGPIFFDEVFENLAAPITVTRGDDHTLTFTLFGEEQSFKWGPSGSDVVPETHIRIKTEVQEALKEAGVNLEVATFLKPLKVKRIPLQGMGRIAVVATYPNPIGTQTTQVRFNNDPEGLAAAEAYGKAIQKKVPKELLTKEEFTKQKEARTKKLADTDLPEDYIEEEHTRQNKMKSIDNQIAREQAAFKREFDYDQAEAARKRKEEKEAAEAEERAIGEETAARIKAQQELAEMQNELREKEQAKAKRKTTASTPNNTSIGINREDAKVEVDEWAKAFREAFLKNQGN